MAVKLAGPGDTFVPAVDAAPEKIDPAAARYAAIEGRLLDAEANAKEKVNREADQRYWLRWTSVVICIAMIFGMAYLLWTISDYLLSAQNPGSKGAYIISLYVAPIASLTALALALLVSAFRGYKDGDERAGMSAASQSAQATGLIN